MGRIVGIDFGLTRIGLAISDEMRIIAQPLATIKAGKDDNQTAEKIAKELASFSKIEAIVLGLPLLLSGKEGEMAIRVKQFKTVLEKVLSLPVFLWDERLTSQQVDKLLRAADMCRKSRSEVSDRLAAATILENFLAANTTGCAHLPHPAS